MKENMQIDVKAEASHIDAQTLTSTTRLKASGITPRLVDVVATEDSAVASYVNTKRKKAEKLGIAYSVEKLERAQCTEDVVELINSLNADPTVHGIMVSTPMYAHLEADEIIGTIAPRKDIDGLTPLNAGLLALNEEHKALIPATALAAIHILELLGPLHGKDVVVVGRGKTIGRPIAQLILNRHASVTVCHSRSSDLASHSKRGQVLVVAIGRGRFVTTDMVAAGQVVVDCGINVIDGRLCGDVDPAAASVVDYLSPVPGGVGVLTNAFLFSNLVKATLLQTKL